jgi:hypothetical protein
MKLRNSMLVLAATLGTSALLANPAAAQEVENVGNAGQFVIGAERLSGIFLEKTHEEDPDTEGERDTSTTNIAFLGNGGGDSPSTTPRFGFDYLVTDGFSVGLAAFITSESSEVEVSGGDTTDTGSMTTIYLNPRAGYAYAIDDTFAIWPRAGIAFATASGDTGEDDTDISGNSIQLTLEGNVVISPFEHFAIVGGPFLDLGLGGSYEIDSGGGNETQEVDQKYTTFGLAVGIAGYIGN